jgi:hypothetical protein
LGGDGEVLVLAGVAHGGQIVYDSVPGMRFLLG